MLGLLILYEIYSYKILAFKAKEFFFSMIVYYKHF